MKNTHAAIALATTVVVCTASGVAIASTPTVRAPHDCTVAFNLADRTFVDYENVTTAVHMMATRGQGEYAGHEATAIQLWDDIDAARAEYRVAKASCLGGAS